MAKFRFSKNKTRKMAIAALCAVTVTCTSLAAACQDNKTPKPDEDTSRAEDTSLLTNGSFEFFSIPDDSIYLIKDVQSWSRSGDSSGALSGIISTALNDWGTISDPSFGNTLDINNDLLHSDEKYVDYNGLKSGDLPYRDTYAAKLSASNVASDSIVNKNDMTYAEYLGIKVEGEDDAKTYTYGEGDDAVTVYYNEDDSDYYFDQEFTRPVRKDVIKNPETHYGSYSEKDGKHYLGDVNNGGTEIYVDEDGNYYKDEDHEYSEGNVLMIHNYPTDNKYNGIQQYYSSTSITLEARSSAKISLWVKTSDLKFDKGYSLKDEQDRGAFIEVVQTVGGTTIDNFTIKAINTEKILKDNPDLGSNGWLQYTVFVSACDFADCTIQLRLGLGKSNGETCTGYAFFDDVEVVKERNIEDTGYTAEIAKEIKDNNTACTLASTDDDKIFYADKAVKGKDKGNARHSTHFNYLVDLASESDITMTEDGYQTVVFDQNSVIAGLTTEKEDGTDYASAESYEGKYAGVTRPTAKYSVHKDTSARPTSSDLLALFASDGNFGNTGIDAKHATALKDALLGEKTTFANLPTYNSNSKMIVMLSVWGASYTSTINDSSFTLDAHQQMIVSFWVKTADMKGKPAATVYIYDAVEDPDKKNAQQITIDTTGTTTDFGDEKDIYNGWVQCFFFVQNDTEENGKTFNIDFSFGNTSVISANSYDGGWVALANMQTLKISKEVYDITATASYTQKFQFGTDEKEKTHHKFAEALGTYDITTEIALPDGYNGVNGASSSVSGADYNQNYDVWNTNSLAGLINKDNFAEGDWHGVLKSFSTSAGNWEDVFGKDCYQPLIIINNLRKYADNAHANEDTYKNYYLLAEDNYEGEFVEVGGKKYRAVKDDEEFDKEATYYTFNEVVNYGFVGSNKTVSSNTTQIVTVKVMVTGNATAYVYLVDADTREVMGYSAPAYTFWYDDEGHVLDEEFDDDWTETQRANHTIYTKQDNGLYKDKKNGNLVANLYNLKKIYYRKDNAHYWYYDGEELKEYKGKKLEEGVDYYTDDTASTLSPHRLCNSDDQPIYELKGVTDNGVYEYYYIVNGKVTKTVVTAFDKQYARYNYDQNSKDGETLADTNYFVEVGNTEDKNGKPQWVTVNFVIKTGSNSKSYRLELWSGKRDETGVKAGSTYDEGAVAFDYSAYSITSSNYESILRTDTDSFEKTIIAKYQKLLMNNEDAAKEFKVDATIKDYEKLAEKYLSAGVYEDLKNSYTAHYYTYSLYDSDKFIPYNKEVAKEGETDYDYTAPDKESLVFFSGKTYTKDDNGEEIISSYNTFIDYSAVEQNVTRETAKPDNGKTDDDDKKDTSGDFWLQLASILLVVVLVFVLLALLARIVIKKVKKQLAVKKQSKNVYRKRERYMKKLHITPEETEEIDNPNLLNNEDEEIPEEVTEEESEEVPAEETYEEAPVEESPAEEAEAPAEEAPLTETPSETTEAPAENPEDKPE